MYIKIQNKVDIADIDVDVDKDVAEELMLLNCGAGEDSWESLGLQGDQTSQS